MYGNYVIAPTRDLVHFGKGHDDNPPGRGSGRYAWGTGNGDGAREEKKQKIKENVKKTASSIGRMAVRSALLGATVAAKVVFNTAITSLTIAGIAAAGFQALNSPEVQTLLTSIGIRAGQWFVDTYVRQGANVAQANIDYLMSVGEEYLETL
jgi:hypothetical protein